MTNTKGRENMLHITNKLVRDKIPEIIKNKGGTATCRTLSDAEFRAELIKKMHEETEEFDKDNTLEELADMYAVLFELIVSAGYTTAEVFATAEKKRMQNGGFKNKLFMEYYNDHSVLR